MAKRTQAKRKTVAKRRTTRSAAARPAAKRTAARKAAGKTAARRATVRGRGTTGRTAARKRSGASGAKLMGRLVVEQKVPVDATRLLTQDHREVASLFDQFKMLEDADEKQALALKICLLLKVHAQIEEELLYPAARGMLDDEDLVDEAEVEHGSAKSLIAQIEKMAPEDELYDAKVSVLGEYVRHHVREEESELFPALRESGLDMMELGGELAARRVELLARLTGKA